MLLSFQQINFIIKKLLNKLKLLKKIIQQKVLIKMEYSYEKKVKQIIRMC